MSTTVFLTSKEAELIKFTLAFAQAELAIKSKTDNSRATESAISYIGASLQIIIKHETEQSCPACEAGLEPGADHIEGCKNYIPF